MNFKFFITILVVALLKIVYTREFESHRGHCSSFCSDIYRPICANNGKTYPNPCYFECAVERHSDLEKIKDGHCRERSSRHKNAEIHCHCRKTLHPVCGTDGLTYHNICWLKCAHLKNRHIKLYSHSPCKYDDDDDITGRSISSDPGDSTAPGIEGVDVPHSEESPHIKDHEAIKDNEEDEGCVCPRIYSPVCGTNGIHYANMCELECTMATNSSVSLAHKGRCTPALSRHGDSHTLETKRVFVPPTSPTPIQDDDDECICPKLLSPVCGTDGINYANMCELKCIMDKHSTVSLAHKGACTKIPSHLPKGDTPVTLKSKKARFIGSDDPPQISPSAIEDKEDDDESCVCPKIYSPVCGTNGIKYANMCELKCVTAKHSSVSFAYKGPCKPASSRPTDRDTPVTPETRNAPLSSPPVIPETKNTRLSSPPVIPPSAIEDKEDDDESCVCPKIYSPVCGTNGIKYANMCELKCVTAKHSSVSFAYKGPCKPALSHPADSDTPVTPETRNAPLSSPSTIPKTKNTRLSSPPVVPPSAIEDKEDDDESCVCPKIYSPVCGTNGIKYASMCELKCVTAKHSSVSFAYKGPCKPALSHPADSDTPVTPETRKAPLSSPSTIPKTKNTRLSSPSAFPETKNARLSSPPVIPPSTTEDKEDDGDDSCVCPRIYSPVCGTNGIKYANMCELKCVTAKQSSVSFAHKGPCKAAPSHPADSDTPVIKPVPSHPADSDTPVTPETKNAPSAIENKEDEDDSCVCPRIYSPVCGTNGIKYANMCELKCVTAKQSTVSLANKGPCKPALSRPTDSDTPVNPENRNARLPSPPLVSPPTVEDNEDDESCVCPRIHSPVCGTNGIKYANMCELKCVTAKHSSVSFANKGPCKPAPSLPADSDTPVTRETRSPRLATPETRSARLPTAETRSARSSSPALVSAPMIEDDDDDDDACVCPRIYSPVCGTNGIKYANMCELKCVTTKSPSVKFANKGKCIPPVGGVSQIPETRRKFTAPVSVSPSPIVNKDDDNCDCPQISTPVCGTNGINYPNICRLKCATAKQSSIRFAYKGRCKPLESINQPTMLRNKPPAKVGDECICQPDLPSAEICGSDDKTYRNECDFTCAAKKNKKLFKVNQGACRTRTTSKSESDGTTEKPDEEACRCTASDLPASDNEPVCSGDGITYMSKCALKCERLKDPAVHVAFCGPCSKTHRCRRAGGQARGRAYIEDTDNDRK